MAFETSAEQWLLHPNLLKILPSTILSYFQNPPNPHDSFESKRLEVPSPGSSGSRRPRTRSLTQYPATQSSITKATVRPLSYFRSLQLYRGTLMSSFYLTLNLSRWGKKAERKLEYNWLDFLLKQNSRKSIPNTLLGLLHFKKKH